jgi:3-deoxy-manno-octulosonate cytidylyltransferase (CMP-KDO synthetase)
VKIIGVIPARMAASRFPGKPLFKIHGRAMVEHVYLRARMFDRWSSLVLATCDTEIENFGRDKSIPVVMTGSHHTRALDRVAELWANPDTVKIIHNDSGEVLYTSRTPVPYCKGAFSEALGARRIYGIFGFRWKYLKAFTEHPETRLEKVESCDSNRILDMPFSQYIAPYPALKSFSVDSPDDIKLVEAHMAADEYWGRYK